MVESQGDGIANGEPVGTDEVEAEEVRPSAAVRGESGSVSGQAGAEVPDLDGGSPGVAADQRPLAKREALLELVKRGSVVLALDGFEEMFIESQTGEVASSA